MYYFIEISIKSQPSFNDHPVKFFLREWISCFLVKLFAFGKMSLGEPAGATIGWVHFLAFDLFVGRWAYLDSRERSISAWLMAPVLFFTLMFGPMGFVLYLVLRTIHTAVSAQKE